jgi:predicted aldo/keto reductase-like oxidoreductase
MSMQDRDETSIDRRGFLQAGAAAGALAVGAGNALGADEPAPDKALPRRKLGKTGVEVTILNQGTWKAPDSLDRLLRFGYSNGIRYIDTAKSYGSEPGIAKWLASDSSIRKSIFLVTKDSPKSPSQLKGMLDQRLKALKVDYVDLIFFHALGDHQQSVDEAIEFAGGKEFKETADAIRKSGKAKFVGFSTHHRHRDQIIQAAVKGGFIDAIMVQNNPWENTAAINKALDAAHKAGIGLISMKQIAGPDPAAALVEIPKRVPELMEKGLSPFGALLHAIWTDERFTTCCVSMRNTDQIRDNTAAARKFAPLKAAQMEAIRQGFLASKPTLCASCDGSCAVAGGTKAALGDMTRYLTYYERHGFRGEARRYFAELSEEARDWKGADLAAAREACPSKLDFAALLPRIERDLA